MGKNLNTTYQISDWLNRPLNKRQIIYAATDAYCLLQIYNKYKEMFKSSCYCKNYQNFLDSYKTNVNNKNGKKRRKR